MFLYRDFNRFLLVCLIFWKIFVICQRGCRNYLWILLMLQMPKPKRLLKLFINFVMFLYRDFNRFFFRLRQNITIVCLIFWKIFVICQRGCRNYLLLFFCNLPNKLLILFINHAQAKQILFIVYAFVARYFPNKLLNLFFCYVPLSGL